MEKSKITFLEIPFDAETFSPAFVQKNEAEYWLEEFKAERVKAFNLKGDKCDIKTIIRGLDSELVIEIVVGQGMKYFIPEIKKIVCKSGFKSVKFSIENPAVMRLYRESFKNYDIEEIERIYRITL